MLPVANVPVENSRSLKWACVRVAGASEKSTSSTIARRVPTTGATSGLASTNVFGRVLAGRLTIARNSRALSPLSPSWVRSSPAASICLAAMIICSSAGAGGMTQ